MEGLLIVRNGVSGPPITRMVGNSIRSSMSIVDFEKFEDFVGEFCLVLANVPLPPTIIGAFEG